MQASSMALVVAASQAGRVLSPFDKGARCIERWMIGYFAGVDPGPSNRVFTLISMSDGVVMEAKSKEAMAADLNSAGEMPIEFFSDPGYVKRGQKGGTARAKTLSPERR